MTPNLLDAAAFVRRNARRLLAWGLVFALIGLGLAFVIPKTFRATASILPPEEDDTVASLQSVRRGLAGIGGIGHFGNYFTQEDVALAVLRSRSVHVSIVNQFSLMKRYHKKNMDDAVKELRQHVSVKTGPDGTISVLVEDQKAGVAAEIANQFLGRLDQFNQNVRTFRARRSRQFLEGRLAQADSSLSRSEALLAEYQKRHGTVLLSPEARGGMAAAADLMSRKVKAEMELELTREYASPSSDEVQRLEAEVRELNRQAGLVPSAQIGGADLVRNASIEEQIVAMLALQLEDARIREAMDTPTIEMLDQATPPAHPIWPRKSWLAAFGFVLGILAGVADARSRGRGTPSLRS